MQEYHLKYCDNDDIRRWLRSKNSQLRRQRKEKKRAERTRRRQLQDQQQAKDERRRQSEVEVQRWMEEKRRMLNRRQQQNRKTLERAKPAADSDVKNNSCSPADGTSNVTRLGKYGGAESCGKTSPAGTKTCEVERQRYGDWLRGRRTVASSSRTGDRDELLTSLEADREDTTKASRFSRVPYPPDQRLKKDRRGCASAVAGRRGPSRPGLTNTGRAQSSEINGTMGTRLEPQGADRCEPVPPELQDNSQKDTEDNSKDRRSGSQGTGDDGERLAF